MCSLTKAAWLTTLALVAAWPAWAQVVRYGDCSIDWELLQLPDCALSVKGNQLYVSQEFATDVFLHRVTGVAATPVIVSGHQWAGTNLPKRGWAYFDRNGLVVVQNVATMDNGPSEFHRGLVRVTREGKWGLAGLNGELVVPMQYDGLLDYKAGYGWLACTECRTVHQGDYSWFSGGNWVAIDHLGKVIGKTNDPTASHREK
jgi:hypothetical protein